jgi:Fic family protein
MATQRAKKLARDGIPLSDLEVRAFHELIFQEAWSDQAGRYRGPGVDIDAFPGGDLPPHSSAVPGEMLQYGRELRERTSETEITPVEEVGLAIWAHMELVRIHPFQEGNGRTARLVMATIMMRHVTGPTRPLVIPEEYRDRYLTAVRSSRAGHDDPFFDLIVVVLDATGEDA